MRYMIELMWVQNKATGKKSYYVKHLEGFRRVSKSEYAKHYVESDGFSCVHSVSTKKHTRHYITAIFDMPTKSEKGA